MSENDPLSALFKGLINSIGSMIPPDFCYVVKNNADESFIHCDPNGMVIWTYRNRANKCKKYLEESQEIACTVHTYDWNSLVKAYKDRSRYVSVDPPMSDSDPIITQVYLLEEFNVK
jgi:hypothetical protein